MFVGIDTHALAEPALASALEVFAANGVEVMIDERDGYTPTPVISRAILTHNQGRDSGLADGVVITPSHNPPEDGGFKYNPPNGGPADTDITGTIERAANGFLEDGLGGVKRIPYDRARKSSCVHRHDYIGPYVADLADVVDMEAIRSAGVKIGIDPLGGAAVHYWRPIIERYGLAATLVSDAVDPTFRFMTVDWDGKIRMDCSSPYAMARLIGMREKFDVAFANDTDADRHGIVTRSSGLMNPNHYLAAAISYLFENRPQWRSDSAVGKTIVSSAIIDRVAQKLGRRLVETPVGFKWFVDGLIDGSFGIAGEESAGASFLRRDGSVWTTDKDGMILGLLAAEMTARTGRDPSQLFDDLTRDLGMPFRIVLPFDKKTFRETSVVDRPGDWGPRYDRICAAAYDRRPPACWLRQRERVDAVVTQPERRREARGPRDVVADVDRVAVQDRGHVVLPAEHPVGGVGPDPPRGQVGPNDHPGRGPRPGPGWPGRAGRAGGRGHSPGPRPESRRWPPGD